MLNKILTTHNQSPFPSAQALLGAKNKLWKN